MAAEDDEQGDNAAPTLAQELGVDNFLERIIYFRKNNLYTAIGTSFPIVLVIEREKLVFFAPHRPLEYEP